MFFDPNDYLELDPVEAESEREASQLRRDAEQRAKLCEAMTRMAAEVGFEAVSAHHVFGAAQVGNSTFYKLYETKEACLLEAFERCAETTFGRVERATEGMIEPAEKARAGLRTLIETFSADPDVARLVLVEIRVGGPTCREAQQRWLSRFARLLEEGEPGGATEGAVAKSRMAVGALAVLLALRVASGASGKELHAMLSDLIYVALTPYVGPAAAMERARLAASAR